MGIPDASVAKPNQSFTPRQSQEELLRRLHRIEACLAQQSKDINDCSSQVREAVREELQGFFKENQDFAGQCDFAVRQRTESFDKIPNAPFSSSRTRTRLLESQVTQIEDDIAHLKLDEWAAEFTSTSFSMRPFDGAEEPIERRKKMMRATRRGGASDVEIRGARPSQGVGASRKQAFKDAKKSCSFRDEDGNMSAPGDSSAQDIVGESSALVCEELTDSFRLGERILVRPASGDQQRQEPPPPNDELPGVPHEGEPEKLDSSRRSIHSEDMTPVMPFCMSEPTQPNEDDVKREMRKSKARPIVQMEKKGSNTFLTKGSERMLKSVAQFGHSDFMKKMVWRGKANTKFWGGSTNRYASWKQRGCWSSLVQSAAFDSFTCTTLILNAVCIGLESDHMARHVFEDEPPLYFWYIECSFTLLFSGELAIRLFVYRWEFLTVPGWQWNVFDTIIVVAQQVDTALTSFSITSSGLMKIVKLLRLVRILRLLRLMRLITELQKMIYLICGSLWSFLWTLVLLLGMVYALGVVITQVVSMHKRENRHRLDDSGPRGLTDFYGSLPLSILSLYQAISGGEDWSQFLDPLTSEISPFMAILFCCYIAFASLVMLNLVTGVFVDSAQRIIKRDKEEEQHGIARSIFKSTDESDDGLIQWAEFQQHLDNPKMEEFFKAIDISMCEARGLFHLLDRDGAGAITLEEFVMGCARLRGWARSVDLAVLSRDHATYVKRWCVHAHEIECRTRVAR